MHDSLTSPFYIEHGVRLVESYKRLTSNDLLTYNGMNSDASLSIIEQLDNAPFVLLSHGLGDDPIFNFGNKSALELFEIDWQGLTKMPSRLSAETINQADREYLLETVTRQGYIDDYSGVRISAKGKRFMIKQAIVWNIIDAKGGYFGQAAIFSHWGFL
ncbi:MEKHLA domain-containing protein [Marinomonas sp. SBI22]|nr:MEKHLA domain-containing protein [Marinomonas sp. SBI22]KZM46505.1 MEKHLA domain-containing protein [Marinomonas sp. SBI8L]